MEKGTGGPLKLSIEQHFTVDLLANVHPNAYVSCCPILKLRPLYHTPCLLLLIKSLTKFTSRDTNLSKIFQRTPMRAPTGAQESEDLAAYSTPCQQEVAKKQTFHPNSLFSAPTLTIIKEKMGE
jgi:hypothetical protein